MEPTENTSMIQKKIALAQGEYAPVVISLLQDLIAQTNQELVGKSEYETLVNAIRLDTHGTLLRGMVDYLEEIRKGILHQ